MQTFRQSAMSGLRPPTKYSTIATAVPSALHEISDSQSNARALAATAMLPPQHGMKRPNTEYRELLLPAIDQRRLCRTQTNETLGSETAQPDAKRKPIYERAGEYKPTKLQPPVSKTSALPTVSKGTSMINLAVSASLLRSSKLLQFSERRTL